MPDTESKSSDPCCEDVPFSIEANHAEKDESADRQQTQPTIYALDSVKLSQVDLLPVAYTVVPVAFPHFFEPLDVVILQL
jgi:hypothetical protein